MTIRIVSLGDSFTEGLGDHWPDGQERGWADRVADALAASHPDQEVWYANLAIRGRKLRQIIDEQVEAALALDPPPTHVTFNGGGNDMLRADFNLGRVMAMSTYVVERFAAEGVRLMIVTSGAPSERMPTNTRFTRISDEFTEAVNRLVAGRTGVVFVDNVHDSEMSADPYWSQDRLHLGPLGHERIAARVLTTLGVPTAPPDVTGVPPLPSGWRAEARYWRDYVAPWIGRRLLRTSSGDGRNPKYPTWVRVTAERPWLPVDDAHAAGRTRGAHE